MINNLDSASLAMIFIFLIPGVEVGGKLSLAFIGGFAALMQIMPRSRVTLRGVVIDVPCIVVSPLYNW